MASFTYTAIEAGGGRVEGVLTGPSEGAVLAELEARRLTPVSIVAAADRSGPRWLKRSGIGARALGESYGQVSDLLHAGVPLLRGLRLLGGRKSRPGLAAVYRALADAVEKGADLGAAMAEMEGVFPPVHVAMVRAGERGGFLESVLGRLGRLVQRQAEMRAKVVGNLVYPGVLVVMGVAVGGIIFGVFVPKFRPVFERMGGELPFITRVVFGASDALGRYAPITALVGAVAGVAVWRLLRREGVRERLEAWKTRMPVVGPLVRGFATARLCQLLGTMLANGVPLLTALQIAKDGAGNLLMERAIEAATESVRAGQALAGPLSASGLLDDDVVEMIAVGESANNLDEVLIKVGETIETRLDRQLGIAVRLIEPLLLVVIAGLVGVVAAALLLPMSKVSGAL